MTDHSDIEALKTDLKSLDIRTVSVEKLLEELVVQVTTLVSSTERSKKKIGRSKKAHVLVAAIEKATKNFIEEGNAIANENLELKQEMLSAVKEVGKSGKAMSLAAREFADDPLHSVKRGNMVKAARVLLLAVARLLILTDMIDVQLLLKHLKVIEDDLENVKNATSHDELMNHLRDFARNASRFINQTAKRQQELKDGQQRDDLVAARAALKKHSIMLLTASKVYITDPKFAAAQGNRDYALKQVCEAVATISNVAQGMNLNRREPGALAAALNEFDAQIIIDPSTYTEVYSRPSLEENLENIIRFAVSIADSSHTRDERKNRIIAECDAMRQALQNLLSEYTACIGVKEPSEGLKRAVDNTHRRSRDLRRQVQKAVVDHVSDCFVETNVTVLVLTEEAKAGNTTKVEEYSFVFTKHANKLSEVASFACSVSENKDGIKSVRQAVACIEQLCPQVINAARILAARPRLKVAQENMNAFKDAWENQICALTKAVDEITNVDDFLAVTESHVLEDANVCVWALQEGDSDTLDLTANAVKGRFSRACDVVCADMDNYEPGIYTERVLEAVRVLRDELMPNFARRVAVAVDALSSNPSKNVDENEFIDSCHLVYDGVREIRRAVLMNRADEELDPDDIAFDDYDNYESRSELSARASDAQEVDEYPDVSGITSAKEAMQKMTEEDKQKIAQQVEHFRSEKLKFDSEVAKWNDTGNDIIVLAKYMCMILIEMTDFTRGRGPLKTTTDVINAAKKISEAGTKLDNLANQIADQCPESSTKKDLLAYLERIALYCHQLNITSKVKAEVQNVAGELIVSGLDSATSLIEAAKNLMNAVVLTVKSSYVASTKYQKQGIVASPIVVWKMKAPEKKPLVRLEKPEEVRAKVRKGSQKKVQNPIRVLSEFQTLCE